MEPFIGQIYLLGFNFPPRGFALCQGQILSIAQNTALFSLLGTMYGGNGQTTFALPDLRGRVPVGMGQGPGLPNYTQGEAAGSPTTTLLITNMPAHNHTSAIPVSSGNATSDEPAGQLLATTGGNSYAAPGTAGGSYGNGAVPTSIAGGSQPFSIMNPYLVLNYSIALQGVFPSRN